MSSIKEPLPLPNEPEIKLKKLSKILFTKMRPKPSLINSESFQKSIEILSKYEYTLLDDNSNRIENKNCFYCKKDFPCLKGKNVSCNECGEIFCISHRNIINHHCIKVNPKKEEYLKAKNFLKERMKMIKAKLH